MTVEEPPKRRHLRAAGALRSGYNTLAQDSKEILNTAVHNFYALRRVRALADKWANALELGTGNPSVVARAFAAEILAALADPNPEEKP